jgi:Epoxide hydrolase N terminus
MSSERPVIALAEWPLPTRLIVGLVLGTREGTRIMSIDPAAMNADPGVRPFHADIAEEAVVDLRRRIAAWRPPEREPVDDQSQGVQLATVQDLANYWAAEYDWRRGEARLNALPQFITSIDGLDVHFIHVRSPQQNALPLIVSHGWPGSIIEQLKIIEPLTSPTEYGGSALDAFDVVIPSLPGYGFSGKPAAAGWGPDRIARAWAVLMERLGYPRYVAQGGDWGTAISAAMARQAPAGEYVQAPRSWTEKAYHQLIYFNQAERGGHFAAWEQPQLFSEELRAAFRPLR